jgi:hypothetical protein
LFDKIIEFEKEEFISEEISKHAKKFSIENFKKEFKLFIDSEIKNN